MKNRIGSVTAGLILDHFKQRHSHDHGRRLDNVAYFLVRTILQRHGFDHVEDLIAFCGEPENLRPWLPIEADRIIFAHGLVQGIREVAVGPQPGLASTAVSPALPAAQEHPRTKDQRQER